METDPFPNPQFCIPFAPSATQKSKTVEFQKEKDTKNTVKFAEVQTPGEAPIIGTLYVQKWFVQGATKLKVTVETQ